MSTGNQQLAIPFPNRGTERRRYMGAHLWWHDAIIDSMLAHPDWTKKQIAESLGCTPAIIYMITGSDLFQAKFEQRRRQFTSIHDQAIVGQLTAVAESALGIIAQTLEKKRDAIPLPLLVDLADKTLNRLGYGVKPVAGPTTAVQVNVDSRQQTVAVSASDLDEARAALRSAEARRLLPRTVSEGDSVTVERSAWDNGAAIERQGSIIDIDLGDVVPCVPQTEGEVETAEGRRKKERGTPHVSASVDQL